MRPLHNRTPSPPGRLNRPGNKDFSLMLMMMFTSFYYLAGRAGQGG